MPTLVLDNGTRVTVTQTEANSILANLNPDEYYNSESKGLVKIADMDTKWLRNAITKSLREELEFLKELSDEEFADAISDGVGNGNEELVNMANNYYERFLAS